MIARDVYLIALMPAALIIVLFTAAVCAPCHARCAAIAVTLYADEREAPQREYSQEIRANRYAARSAREVAEPPSSRVRERVCARAMSARRVVHARYYCRYASI